MTELIEWESGQAYNTGYDPCVLVGPELPSGQFFSTDILGNMHPEVYRLVSAWAERVI